MVLDDLCTSQWRSRWLAHAMYGKAAEGPVEQALLPWSPRRERLPKAWLPRANFPILASVRQRCDMLNYCHDYLWLLCLWFLTFPYFTLAELLLSRNCGAVRSYKCVAWNSWKYDGRWLHDMHGIHMWKIVEVLMKQRIAPSALEFRWRCPNVPKQRLAAVAAIHLSAHHRRPIFGSSVSMLVLSKIGIVLHVFIY